MISFIFKRRKPGILKEYTKLLRETTKAQKELAKGSVRKGNGGFIELVGRLKNRLRRSPPTFEEKWLIILEEDLLKEET